MTLRPVADPFAQSGQGASEEEQEAELNKGKLLVDASCAPADIRYPTDISLLNEAREKTAKMRHRGFLSKGSLETGSVGSRQSTTHCRRQN